VQLAFFGGIYNNYLALEAAIRDAQRRRTEEMFCLGDLGAFGPHPDRVFDLVRTANVMCIQGNYDHSIGNDLQDCRCGYTDQRDNHFAQISYDYTYQNTSPDNRVWMRDLPKNLRFEYDGVRFLLSHGTPRQTNEFLWESTTSTHFLDKLADDYQSDLILGTHTGIHWQRALQHGRRFVNVGVLGRPENDGNTNVWYTIIRTGNDAQQKTETSFVGSTLANVDVEFVPVNYDHERLAREMLKEKLPDEFIKTILTGWWTTCLEVLPAKERQRGKY